MNYLPLNVQSGYSILQSALKIEDIIYNSYSNGLKYASCCDDNMYSLPILNAQCKKKQITPIFGINIDLKVDYLNSPLKICLFIKNDTGYYSLCKIINSDRSLKKVISNADGLILIIPTISNEELSYYLISDENGFTHHILELSKHFEDTYFGVEYYQKSNKEFVNHYREFASKHNFLTVCFPKHRYVNKGDALSLEILSAIKNDSKIDTKDEINGPYYFLKEHAINTLYTKDEIQNTFKIAKSISFSLSSKRGSLLQYPYQSDLSSKKFLYFLCNQNAKKLQIQLNENYINRLEYEIDIIDKMGFCSYFLIVQDYVNYAKDHQIPIGPGRGSAAGSLVSYLLGITDVDPLKYNLLFERFLNPERVSMPDIDIDIADYARQDVIDYIYKKYGHNKMSYIITFQTIGAKQSIRDIGRVFSINSDDINTICNAIKGTNISLKESLQTSSALMDLYKDSYFNKIINLAMKIEGLPRQESIHAAGIILNQDDLNNVLPLNIHSDGKYISQFESIYLEELGFLKMDLLGLRNLTLITSIENDIKKVYPSFSLKKISFTDQRTFDVLKAGLTQGIFQLESEGITNALKTINVSSFNDLVDLLALYRPGPMDNINFYAKRKNNQEKIDYIHPSIKDILKTTYGIIIYQEQIMQIVQRVSNFSLSQADLFRRAISKKDASKFEELKKSFIDGALNNHYTIEEAEKIFSIIDKFANYGFNKSHSVSYAIITYQLAYLKSNYPSYFLATMLTYLTGSENKYAKFMRDINLFQIKLLLPNINYSKMNYQVVNNNILLPFTSIKGLPVNLAEALIYERNLNGKYLSLENFYSRTMPYGFNESHYFILINSGALDLFNYNRVQLRKSLNAFIQYASMPIESISLFSDSFKPVIKKYPVDRQYDLEQEYSALGIIISGSLFEKYSNFINHHMIKSIFYLSSSRQNVNIGVVINKVKEITTKNKNKMAIVYGFDDSQDIEIVVFNKLYEQCRNLLIEKNIVLVNGNFKQNEYGLSFIANNIIKMEENDK